MGGGGAYLATQSRARGRVTALRLSIAILITEAFLYTIIHYTSDSIGGPPDHSVTGEGSNGSGLGWGVCAKP